MQSSEIPEPIQNYFVLAAQPDREAYFKQFAMDAVVEDEGKKYRGLEAIRSWRGDVPLVAYKIQTIENEEQTADVVVEISGEFPGSPVDLTFHFEFDPASQLRVLTIRP